MNAKRIVAFLGAALLIVIALLVRSALNNDSPSSSAGNGSTGDTPAGFSLVCSTEFKAECGALAASLGTKASVVTEPAGKTLDRLSNAEAKDLPDAWLTLAPFPQMLDQIRQRQFNLLAAVGTADVIGLADPGITLQSDRAKALQSGCDKTPLLKCIGSAAGQPWTAIKGGQKAWDNVKLSVPDPANEAAGLVAIANASFAYYGKTDLSAIDFGNDSDFTFWLKTLAKNVVTPLPGSTPLDTLLIRPSRLNVASTDSAEVAHATAIQPASLTNLTTLNPTPAVQEQAVFALFAGARTAGASTIKAQLTDALQHTYGWSAPAAAVAAPSEDTFIALRALWKE